VFFIETGNSSVTITEEAKSSFLNQFNFPIKLRIRVPAGNYPKLLLTSPSAEFKNE
jgi:hypothetical protein